MCVSEGVRNVSLMNDLVSVKCTEVSSKLVITDRILSKEWQSKLVYFQNLKAPS